MGCGPFVNVAGIEEIALLACSPAAVQDPV